MLETNVTSTSSIDLTHTVLSSIQQGHKITKDFYIGLTLALLSSFFIGASFILKKKGLLKLCETSDYSSSSDPNNKVKRAGQGGYGYLKEWLWWAGLLTMALGELCNFAAYGFVPATLVTPLGALSVLISAILSAYFLNEKLSTIGKIGCFLTAIGSTIMVIHAPKEGEIKSLSELLGRLKDIEFVIFIIVCILSLFVLIFMMVPRYGNTNVLIYILICSILGSFTVMGCKGLSLGVKEMFTNQPSASYFWTYLFIILVLILIILQMNYLNKSLDTFNTAVVTTVYYVLFTLFVMINSSLLFKELLSVSFEDFVGCMCGFSVIVCALFMIHFFKPSDNQNESGNEVNSRANDNINDFVLRAESCMDTENLKKRDSSSFRLLKTQEDGHFQSHLLHHEQVNNNLSTSVSSSNSQNENSGNLLGIPKSFPQASKSETHLTHNFGMLENKNEENNSILKRLTDKNLYKNYFNQFKSLNYLSTPPKYNMLRTTEENENDSENEKKIFGQNSYAKLKTTNIDFDDSFEQKRAKSLVKNSNKQNFFKMSKNFFLKKNTNRNKNLSFDGNIFENDESDEKEEIPLSVSLDKLKS